MEYELALKLNGAGYPQKDSIGTGEGTFVSDGNGTVYAPSLSELIEACGEGFEMLTQAYEDGKGYWWATASGNRIREFAADTPIEAVALLYLALHTTN